MTRVRSDEQKAKRAAKGREKRSAAKEKAESFKLKRRVYMQGYRRALVNATPNPTPVQMPPQGELPRAFAAAHIETPVVSTPARTAAPVTIPYLNSAPPRLEAPAAMTPSEVCRMHAMDKVAETESHKYDMLAQIHMQSTNTIKELAEQLGAKILESSNSGRKDIRDFLFSNGEE